MTDIAVNNYLVPAVGTPLAQVVDLALGGGGSQTVEFRSTKLDGVNFVPTGVYSSLDNASLTFSIQQLGGFEFSLVGGESANYPAPPDQSITVTGSGNVKLVFVNYPIIN